MDLLWEFGLRAWFGACGVILAVTLTVYVVEVVRVRRHGERPL